MDYSLLLGIHDCTRAEAENYELEEPDGEEDEDSEGGGERVPWGTTPPDSPHQLLRETSLQYETGIVPELDIYAIPSSESKYLYILKAYSLDFQ
jgi:1-phosphatidylinositol-5-phosphate 4-kinase